MEQSFPVADAHNRLSDDGVSIQDRAQVDELVNRAVTLRSVFLDTHPHLDDFVSMLLGMEPYGSSNEFETALRKALAD